MFGIDGELIRWAATGIATVGAWLIGRHDKLLAERTQRKSEQAEARRAAKALAEAMAAKNAEIDYLRGQNEHLLGLLLQREGHG